MKKMRFISFSLLGLMCAALLSCGDGNNANQQETTGPDSTQQEAPAAQQAEPDSLNVVKDVPEDINAFVKKYFPDATIARVTTENEPDGKELDVTLSDGTEVDFDVKNQWDNVDCKTKAVPADLVPAAIASYVKEKYQSLTITKIDKDEKGYDIKLSDGVELKFDTAGKFIGVDK